MHKQIAKVAALQMKRNAKCDHFERRLQSTTENSAAIFIQVNSVDGSSVKKW